MVSPIDIGGKIFDIFSGLDSKQKCIVEVTNSTGHMLKRISDEHSSGGFATLPEDEIPPDGKDAFISHDTGILRGADGKVTYGVFPEGAEAAIGKWTIHWDIPQVGSPSSEATLDGLDAGKFQSLHRIGDGNETEAKFELKSEHDKKKKETPGPTPATGELKSTVLITVKNNTKHTITLIDQGHDHGGFVDTPALEILPFDADSFASYETDRAKPGSKGFLKYRIDKDTEWTISWDNPESADNTSDSKLDGAGKDGYVGLDQIGAGEENVPATFTISASGGGGDVPVPPKPGTANSCEVRILNNSNQTLTLLDSSAFNGELLREPDQEIPAGGAVSILSAEKADDDTTGCSGYVRYQAGSVLWTLLWDNPEHGDNTSSSNLEGDGAETFHADHEVTQDKANAVATFTLAGGPADKKKEPDFTPPPETGEPTLRLGDQSVDGWVEYLQMRLNTLNFGPLPVDGNFDHAVLAAVRAFQTARHIQVDGTVGNQTWAALRDETPQPPSTDGRQPHTYVEQGPEARFFTESSAVDYIPESDQLMLTAANTGNETIMPYQFEATARITFPSGEQHTFTVPLSNQGRPSQPGEMCFFEGSLGMHLESGTYWFEAYMPAELGGDETAGELVIP